MDLFYSFHLLFEGRLGWQLYRPIGREWAQENYWKISNEPIVQTGYLSTQNGEIAEELAKHPVFTDPNWARYGLELLRVGSIREERPGIYRIEDKSKDDFWQRGLSLEAFKQEQFDIIISSVPWHWDIYEELRQRYQPQAKHVHHVGNKWAVTDAPNLLMHLQEFDLNVFRFVGNRLRAPSISSYVHFPESEVLMREVASLLPNIGFRFVGKTLGPTKDMIVKSRDLARNMQTDVFTWHIKPGGEGYGHVLFNSFATGTPVIINTKDYEGTAGGRLLIDGRTCINTDGKSAEQIASQLKFIMETPGAYTAMSERVHYQFKQVVDFDREFNEKLKPFLENLK